MVIYSQQIKKQHFPIIAFGNHSASSSHLHTATLFASESNFISSLAFSCLASPAMDSLSLSNTGERMTILSVWKNLRKRLTKISNCTFFLPILRCRGICLAVAPFGVRVQKKSWLHGYEPEEGFAFQCPIRAGFSKFAWKPGNVWVVLVTASGL